MRWILLCKVSYLANCISQLCLLAWRLRGAPSPAMSGLVEPRLLLSGSAQSKHGTVCATSDFDIGGALPTMRSQNQIYRFVPTLSVESSWKFDNVDVFTFATTKLKEFALLSLRWKTKTFKLKTDSTLYSLCRITGQQALLWKLWIRHSLYFFKRSYWCTTLTLRPERCI